MAMWYECSLRAGSACRRTPGSIFCSRRARCAFWAITVRYLPSGCGTARWRTEVVIGRSNKDGEVRSMRRQESTPVISRDRYDAVLLDLDGVITDTASIHAACWKQMFDEYL